MAQRLPPEACEPVACCRALNKRRRANFPLTYQAIRSRAELVGVPASGFVGPVVGVVGDAGSVGAGAGAVLELVGAGAFVGVVGVVGVVGAVSSSPLPGTMFANFSASVHERSARRIRRSARLSSLGSSLSSRAWARASSRSALAANLSASRSRRSGSWPTFLPLPRSRLSQFSARLRSRASGEISQQSLSRGAQQELVGAGVDGVVVGGVVGVVGAVGAVGAVVVGGVVGAGASAAGTSAAVVNVSCVWRICTEEKNRARLKAEDPLIWERVMRKASEARRSA